MLAPVADDLARVDTLIRRRLESDVAADQRVDARQIVGHGCQHGQQTQD